MATFEVDVEGATYEVDAPDENTAWKWANETHKQAPQTSFAKDIAQGIENLTAGAVRGAGSIGATILAPYDMAKDALAGKGLSLESNRQRRAAMDAGLQEMGAQPDSWMYQGGKLAGEIAGTAGVGGVAANVAGRVLPQTPRAIAFANAIRSGGMNTGMPAAKALSMEGVKNAATRIGGGAIAGGAMAGTINPETAPTGALIGGAFPVVGKLAGESGRLLKEYAINPLFKPSNAAINKLVQDAGGVEQAREAIGRAIKSGKTMSGESYTLGQAGKNAGLASTERARSAVRPENFQNIYQAQRAARIKALQGIGQDEIALENAIAARSNNARDVYGAVNDKVFTGSDDLKNLLGRARAGGALTEAQKIAEIEGRKFSIPVINDMQHAAFAPEVLPLARETLMNPGIPQEPLREVIGQAIKGGDLHTVKMGIDQAIGSAQGHQKAALVQLKNEFIDWLGKQSPEYLAANAKYAADSRPINQMKIAQKLTDVLTGPAYAHGAEPGQAISGYMRALKNAPSIAKQETGMRQPLNKIFEKGQLSTIKQVARELAKDVDLNSLGKGIGSDTAQKQARSNMLSSLMELVNTSRVGHAAENFVSLGARGRMNNQLDAMLVNPEYAGKSLDELTKSQRNRLAELLANPAVRALPIAAQSK